MALSLRDKMRRKERCLLSFFTHLIMLCLPDGKWTSLPDVSEAEGQACQVMAHASGATL